MANAQVAVVWVAVQVFGASELAVAVLDYYVIVVALSAGALAVPSAQVENFRGLFLLFGAVFVLQAVLVLTDPSRLSPQV